MENKKMSLVVVVMAMVFVATIPPSDAAIINANTMKMAAIKLILGVSLDGHQCPGEICTVWPPRICAAGYECKSPAGIFGAPGVCTGHCC